MRRRRPLIPSCTPRADEFPCGGATALWILPPTSLPLGSLHGASIRQEGFGQGREGDARAEGRDPQVRSLGQEGQEPEAGDRDRPLGGSSRRRQGSGEEVEPLPLEAAQQVAAARRPSARGFSSDAAAGGVLNGVREVPRRAGATTVALLRSDPRLAPEAETPLRIEEEEVPREGAIVERAFQFARWFDGRALLWLGRRKGVGRGEGASRLRFDVLDKR